MLTARFWGAVDSFADLFDGFYYIFTGESTSKADKFDNMRLIIILNTPLTQKSLGIRTKRPEQEPNLQTKKGAIRVQRLARNCQREILAISRSKRFCTKLKKKFKFSNNMSEFLEMAKRMFLCSKLGKYWSTPFPRAETAVDLEPSSLKINHNGLGRQGLPSVRCVLGARTCITDSVVRVENVIQIVWNE